MKKRILAILLALCMVCGLLPARTNAATVVKSGTFGDFINWELTDDGTLTVTGRKQFYSTGYLEELRQDIEDDIIHIVIDVDFESFPCVLTRELPNLETVVMGDSFTEFYDDSIAFADCPKLRSVKLSDNLTFLPGGSFMNCSSLTSITLPNSLTYIGSNAFENSGLESIVVPGSVEELEDYAFANCPELHSVVLEEGVAYIGERAFQSSPKLKELTIPVSAKVGHYALMGSYIDDLTVKTVDLRSSESLLSGVTTVTYDAPYVPENAFWDCSELTSVMLTDQVTAIYSGAFAYCTSLESIDLHEGITTIEGAFSRTGLKELILPSTLVIEEGKYFGASYMPNLEKVVLPESATSISFTDCPQLAEINLSHVKVIPEQGFENCSSLATIDLSSAEDIGRYAFNNCTSLETIIWPVHTAQIGECVFMGCTSLTEIIWPATQPDVPSLAFSQCTNLESITFPETMESIGAPFGACESLTSFTIYSMDCEFTDPDLFAESPNVVIYAYEGSTAEALAAEKGIPFSRIIDPSKHNFDEGIVTTEATCTEPGVMTYTCTDEGCGETYTEEIPALGHDFTDVAPVFDAETHTHIYDCTRCDATTSDDCTFDEGVVTTEATPNNLGIREYTCTVCGGSYEETYVCRISGSSRYDTGYAVADALKAQLGVEEFDHIIVASGLGYADALSASYLAAVKEAPILLVNERRMEEVADYIRENMANDGMIYLIGGEGAISAEMEEILDGFNMKRLHGKNRYETNMEILKEAGTEGQEILICTGRDFPDSLSASAVGKPILLVNKTLYDYQKEFLEESSGEFVIIGGVGAVSEDMEAELEEFGEITRLGGSGRYETCVMVAEYFFPEGAEAAIVAYSRNFPDGLCGGPLAYAMNAPLLLLQTDRGPEVIEYANETGIQTGAVLGGASLIDDATVNKVFVE